MIIVYLGHLSLGDARASHEASSSYQTSYRSAVKQDPLYDKYKASEHIMSSSVGPRDHQTSYTTTAADAFCQTGKGCNLPCKGCGLPCKGCGLP